MLLRSFLIVVLLNLLCLHASYAAPTVRFGPVHAWVVPAKGSDQQPNLREVNDGYYLRLFEQEENAGQEETYVHIIRHIISDAGVQGASNISIHFNPSYEQLTVHKIIVWRDGQPIDKLQKDGFQVVANEEQLSMFVYNGNYTAYTILKDIRSGDEIEYDYTISGSNPVFEKKFCSDFVFEGSDPIGHVHHCIIAPAARTFTFKYLGNAEKPVVTTTNGTTLYEWDKMNVKGAVFSSNAPAWFNPAPQVQISEYKSWGEVADWAYSINTPDDKLGGALGARIAQLKRDHSTDSARFFRAMINMVQAEVRYMGVEIGAYSHRANRPEKVYEQRYGDCKDKSLLLVSMLRSAGISAYMALVNAGRGADIDNDIPSPYSFNHAIVVAHFAGQDIWIDPTMSYQGGTGTHIYCPRYGKALVLRPGNNTLTTLTTLPDVPMGAVKYIEDYTIYDAQKPATLTVYTTFNGNEADYARRNFAKQSKADLEKNYLDYYSKIFPHVQSADTLTIYDDKDGNEIQTIEHYTVDDLLQFDSVNQYYYANFYARVIKNELPIVENKKTYPVAVDYPLNINYSVRVTAPITWQIKPKHETINRNAYNFSYDISASSAMLQLNYEFTYKKDNIASDELATYEQDRKKMVDDYLEYAFTWTPSAGKRNMGVNYLAILAVLALLAACVYGGIRIYHTHTERSMNSYHEPKALGGWLILVMIGLGFSICRGTYYLCSTGFFGNALWHVYDTHREHILFVMMMWFELLFNVWVAAVAAFCLVLCFKKRDILPKYVKILLIGSLIGVAADTVFAGLIFPSSSVDYKSVFRSLIAVCIWVPYFSRSLRVKETFVVPYPNVEYTLPAQPYSDAPEEETPNP